MASVCWQTCLDSVSSLCLCKHAECKCIIYILICMDHSAADHFVFMWSGVLAVTRFIWTELSALCLWTHVLKSTALVCRPAASSGGRMLVIYHPLRRLFVSVLRWWHTAHRHFLKVAMIQLPDNFSCLTFFHQITLLFHRVLLCLLSVRGLVSRHMLSRMKDEVFHSMLWAVSAYEF